MLSLASSSTSELILEILNLIVAETKAVRTFNKIKASKDVDFNDIVHDVLLHTDYR